MLNLNLNAGLKFSRLARYLAEKLVGSAGAGAHMFGRKHHISSRPTGRMLRDPGDPAQAARMLAAEDKRERKQIKRDRDAHVSWVRNPCVDLDDRRSNPRFVAR